MAGKGGARGSHHAQAQIGQLRLLRAIPATAEPRGRWDLQETLVALLDLQDNRGAAGAGSDARGTIQKIYPVILPDEFDQQIQSWDMGFKDLQTSDYVAGGVWAAKKADRYLLDQVRERFSFPETLAAVKRMSQKWPKTGLKLVEDKANGPAVI